MKKTTIITFLIILVLLLPGCSDKKTTKTSTTENITSSEISTISLTEPTSGPVVTYDAKSDSTQASADEPASVSEKESEPSGAKETLTVPDVPETTATEAAIKAPVQTDFVADLKIASSVSQLITVSAVSSSATVIMHEKDSDGIWHQIHTTSGFTGYQGVGSASEGSAYTPEGLYGLSIAFGIQPDPGTGIGNYTQVDNSHYWVDDPASAY